VQLIIAQARLYYRESTVDFLTELVIGHENEQDLAPMQLVTLLVLIDFSSVLSINQVLVPIGHCLVIDYSSLVMSMNQVLVPIGHCAGD
jgi:hypothetical protein